MARSRELKVVIAGDADKLDRAVRKSNDSLDKLGKQTRLTASLSSRGFSAMRVAATGATAGIAGLVVATKSVVDAAIESEKSQAKLAAQLKASGISYKAHAKEIDNVIQKTSQLAGLDDEDLQDAFTAIVRSTGSVNKSLKDMTLVADLARAKHMDVAKAGELVAKVHAGNVGPLRRMGIEFQASTANVDKLKASTDKYTPAQLKAAKAADLRANSERALSLLQGKVSGQAEAYGKTTAGSIDRANVAFENLREVVGGAVAPVVEKAANKFAAFVTQMQNGTGAGGRFVRSAREVWQELQPVIGALGQVGKYLVSHPRLVVALVGAFAGFKVLSSVNAAFKLLNSTLNANPYVRIATLIIAIGAALVTAYQKSATFRKIVVGALQGVTKALDFLVGGFSSMLSALGRVPGFGWARKAADAIDRARAATRGFVDGLNKVPKHVDVAINIKPSNRTSAKGLKANDLIIPGFTPRASGGVIPGTGDKDTVPIMGTPGEFVIRKQIVERFGPTFFAAINEGREPQRFSDGGIVSRANTIASKHYPYVWGGGHSRTGVPNDGGYDCSGAVSAAVGVSPPRVSGGFTTWGSPGPGNPMDTKVFANAEHVFMVINGRGWGTSKENPGGGPGWLSYNYRPGFAIRHTNDGGNSGSSAGDTQESVEAGKQRKTLAQQKAGSRLANRIIGATSKAVNAATGRATAIGGVIEDADAGYARSERFFGQVLGGVPGAFGEEDLGTATGRSQRTIELNELKALKKQQLSRMRKRMAALRKSINGRQRTLKALRNARDRAHGAKRAKLTERLKPYEDRTIDLQAELKALGGSISDIELDIGDLDKDLQDVASTPDTDVGVADAPGLGSVQSDLISQNLSDLDLQERAGVLTPEQAKATRIANIQAWLAGALGPLDQRTTWELMADLKDAQQNSAQSVDDLAAAVRENTDAVRAQVAFADSVAAVTSMQAVRAMGDMITGQLGARVAQRSQLPGTGALARL